MKPPKVSKNRIEQVIDLSEVLGRVRLAQAPDLKLAIGQAIADYIVERTEGGRGVKFSEDGQGRAVKLKSPYSDAYAKSLDFKAAGKSKNKVNMRLTGDMLSSIQVRQMAGNKIAVTIGPDQAPKAFNHITGDTVPERPFFGVTKSEVSEILKDFRSDIERIETRARDEQAPVRRRLADILAELEDEYDGEG